MRNHSICLILLVSLLLLAGGCSSQGGASSSTSGTPITGKEGIKLAFINSIPPVMYYDSTLSSQNLDFDVLNKGASVSNVKMKFYGFDETLVKVDAVSDASFQNDGGYKTRYNPEGGYDTRSTRMSLQSGLANLDTYEFALKLVYCYNYATEGSVTLCIDPDPSRNVKEDSCTPTKVTTSGQAAPISIDSVESESMMNKVRLKINLKDYSGGQVVNKNLEDCISTRLERTDEDYISIDYIKLGETDPISGSCNFMPGLGAGGIGPSTSSSGLLKLRDKSASLVCTFDLSSPSAIKAAYKTVLRLRASYVIKNSIEKNIKIVNENAQKKGI